MYFLNDQTTRTSFHSIHLAANHKNHYFTKYKQNLLKTFSIIIPGEQPYAEFKHLTNQLAKWLAYLRGNNEAICLRNNNDNYFCHESYPCSTSRVKQYGHFNLHTNASSLQSHTFLLTPWVKLTTNNETV